MSSNIGKPLSTGFSRSKKQRSHRDRSGTKNEQLVVSSADLMSMDNDDDFDSNGFFEDGEALINDISLSNIEDHFHKKSKSRRGNSKKNGGGNVFVNIPPGSPTESSMHTGGNIAAEEVPEFAPYEVTDIHEMIEVDKEFERCGPKRLDEQIRRLYSTTSTIFAQNSINNPDCEQLFYCLAAVIQAQIFEDHSASEESRYNSREFELAIDIPPEFGGTLTVIPPDIVEREAANDDALRELILQFAVPTIDSIIRFLSFLSDRAEFSPECNIIAMIYLNRITANSRMLLTERNWRITWASCVILAQKVWDDRPLKTSAFACILPPISSHQLHMLEFKTLKRLDYSTGVKPSLYAKYYFELRHLFTEIIVTSWNGSQDWTMKPLSIAQAQILEYRSNRSGRLISTSHKHSKGDVNTKVGRLPKFPHSDDNTSIDGVSTSSGGSGSNCDQINVNVKKFAAASSKASATGNSSEATILTSSTTTKNRQSLMAEQSAAPNSSDIMQVVDASSASLVGSVSNASLDRRSLASSASFSQRNVNTAENAWMSYRKRFSSQKSRFKNVTLEDITRSDTSRYVIS